MMPRRGYKVAMADIACDLAIIGGGLSGGLIALAARRARPDRRIALVEAAPTLGGNQLWSFIGSDVGAREKRLLAPLVSYGWREFGVEFPGYRRMLAQPLYGIRSDRFDATLRGLLPAGSIFTGRRAADVRAETVVLEDGTRIAAQGVIDARGAGDLSLLDLHWRKSVGYEVTVDGRHGVRSATLIDTTGRTEGFQYRVMLPIEEDRLYIEDARLEADGGIDMADHASRILAFAARCQWRVRSSAHGVAAIVPVARGGDFERYWRSGSEGVAKTGLRAGLFHPVTGNRLADAARTALMIAHAPDWSGAALHDMLHAHAAKSWARRDYYRRFARRMIGDGPSAESCRPLKGLYAMDPGLIARFHAMTLRLSDRMALSLSDGSTPLGAIVRR